MDEDPWQREFDALASTLKCAALLGREGVDVRAQVRAILEDLRRLCERETTPAPLKAPEQGERRWA